MKRNDAPIVKGILKEELDRARALQAKYERKIQEYPPGYLLKRKRASGKLYYYLSYRQGGQMKQEYLGPLEPAELKNYEKKIEEKNALRGQLIEVKKNIKYLERLLRK